MQQHLILDTPEIVISYDYSNQWLHANWRGHHTQESARTACQHMLEALSQWPTAKILNDNTNVTTADMQLTGWGLSWLLDMHTAGLRFAAWVYAPDFKGRKNSEEMLKYVEKPVIATFTDMAAATQWLRQQRATE
ncbi:hypothetical protein GCM10027346_30590 [Hymenobacter seoulensis]